MPRLGRTAIAAVCLALATAAPAFAQAAPGASHVDFSDTPASVDTRRLADWVVTSGDAHGLPFLIVDKTYARVFAFDAEGAVVGNAPALLGLAKGDVSPPGVGSRRLADIGQADRITPAGRFEAGLGRDLTKEILWIDYDAAISLHPVVPGTVAERRAQRLATPSVLDNRISYGCINVPLGFYEGVVQPLFEPANGIVYILPEMSALTSVLMLAGKK